MNQFFQLLASILMYSPDMSHNLEVKAVSQKGEMQYFRPVLLDNSVKVKCNGNVMDFEQMPGILQVQIMDKVQDLIAA